MIFTMIFARGEGGRHDKSTFFSSKVVLFDDLSLLYFSYIVNQICHFLSEKPMIQYVYILIYIHYIFRIIISSKDIKRNDFGRGICYCII